MVNKIVVDDQEIGGESTFIIAEIGSNHNQSLDLAYESIDAAVECGANAVKFQSIDIDELYYRPSEKTKALHRKIDMDESWHHSLSDYCKQKGIIFFSAPTYLRAVDILEEIDVPLYKLASAQIGTFPQIVEKVASTGKPVILSTGIITADDLAEVIDIFRDHGNEKFVILHCNSIYPTPYDKVHLSTMSFYQHKYDCIVGFSDHTPGIYVPVAAVAQGAKVIEKHFILDKKIGGPDASFSLDKQEFKMLVDSVRDAERSLGLVDYELTENKKKSREFSRSLFVVKDIKKGDILTEDNVRSIRPGYGIKPKHIEFVIGKRARKDISKGTPVSWGIIE